MAFDRPLRIFLDANVIFSGLYSPAGTNGRILDLAVSGAIHGVISAEIIDELARNVQRKAPRLMVRLALFLDEAALLVMPDPEPDESGRWFEAGLAEDAHVVASALEAESDYVCTGDRRLRQRMLGVATAVRPVTPRELPTLLGLP
jgi:predicted nucleic acid-binding protein